MHHLSLVHRMGYDSLVNRGMYHLSLVHRMGYDSLVGRGMHHLSRVHRMGGGGGKAKERGVFSGDAQVCSNNFVFVFVLVIDRFDVEPLIVMMFVVIFRL